MGLTAAQRKANQRARDKGLPEPYNSTAIKADEEARAEKESQIVQLLEEVAAYDKEGKRFRSEARSYTKLVRLYFGQPEIGDEDEEASEIESKKTKKNKRPNPSETRIRIQNSDIDPTVKGKGRRRSIEDITYEVDDIVGFWRWLNLRDRARKDLFWLGRLLGNGFYRSVHQPICDQFVQKNFGGPWLNPDGSADTARPNVDPMYFDGYTLDDFHGMISAHHYLDEDGNVNPLGRLIEMMLLDSRGFYKSTINSVDSTQWMLCCPDIRILIITGEYKLAIKFLGAVKKYFSLAEGQEPTAFHLLFPEYVLYGKDGTSDSPLECPARLLRQDEPSLWVNSIVANLSGWHCDIKKGDDIVTDENSNSEEAREKLKEKYDGTDDLLDPHGFMDHIGTRYFTDDWYGMRLSPDKETGEVAAIKYYKRGCWVVKPEYADVPLNKLTAEMVDLTFPQRWGFNKLRALLLKKMAGTGSDRAFRNQQLNEPTDAAEDSGFKISFTEADLRAHMYQREAAPKSGDIFIVWDWALSDKKTSDYSSGVVARLYKNDAGEWSFVILEIIYDKWKHSELAFQIVALSKRWGPKVTMIEASNAADMLKDEITRVGHRFGYQPYIYWKQPSRQENAKRNRIKSVEILLNEHRLHFVLGPWIDETFKQLTQYTGEKKNKGRKDDIPDAISYLTYILPAGARPIIDKVDPDEEKRLAEEQAKQIRKQAQYDRYFGQHLQTNTQAGPVIEEVAPPKPQDPRMKIFGNKGPWRL
jgi:phage terminase large subunit-like protein